MEFEIVSMNDKSSIPAPKGGTPGSSQSEVREEKSQATQEKLDERQYREDVEAGVDMSTPTEVSQTWEEDYVMAGLLRNEFRIWDEKVATNWHINHDAIQSFISKKIAQAKRQERERILEKMTDKLEKLPELLYKYGYDKVIYDFIKIIHSHD